MAIQQDAARRSAIVAPLAAGAAALIAGLVSQVLAVAPALSITVAALSAAVGGALALNWQAATLVEQVTTAGEAAGGALDRLAREKAQLVAALEAGADAVVAVDADGNMSFMNAAAERLFGARREGALGRPFAWVVPNPDAVEALDESRARGSRVVRSTEGPNRQLLQVTTAPLPGDGGAALAVFHDVTDVRRAEQMRRDFVANVSHELRTPLSSIKAVLETLEGGAISDPAAAQDFIARAETEVDRLTSMMTDLLELSRIESGAAGEQGEFDVAEAVRAAADRLRSQAVRRGIELACEIEPGLPLVAGDAERIERAVMNLVENAIKFTLPGGHIRVHGARREDAVAIEVSDDGAGVDERDLPRIFERFYKADNSRRTVGSGLGLALVKHTAEAYGGSVSVESTPRKGSRFTILLPAAARIAPQAAAEARPMP